MAWALERWLAPYLPDDGTAATSAKSATHNGAIERSVSVVANVARGRDGWGEAEEERAAFVEYDGSVPRPWAEALARLDPAKPPRDVPPWRWLRFIDDCGRFLDGGWGARAVTLGWGPLDLFGCDRERPFVHDHKGLLWLLDGGSILQMHRDRATIKTQEGAQQTYRRRPVEVGRVVLAWELAT